MFCRQAGCHPVFSPLHAVLNFLAVLSDGRMRACGSVSAVASSLSFWFRVNDATDLTKHAVTGHLLRGTKRLLGLSVRQKKPMSPFLLKEIGRRVDVGDPQQTACWAVTLCDWWGGCFGSPASFRGHRGLVLRCRWGKTIQFRERAHAVLLPRAGAKQLRPVISETFLSAQSEMRDISHRTV
jgi:hypothetical protein